MTIASPLRELTRAEHETVDRLYSRFDLSDAAGYRAFLAAQAGAHLAVEGALDRAGAADAVADWPERRRAGLLRADLAELGVEPRPSAAPELSGEAELLGAVYVLEGSRLGGALLSSRLAAGAPARFLGAQSRRGSWRSLLMLLASRLEKPADLAAAAAAARACFGCFERSALAELELVLA